MTNQDIRKTIKKTKLKYWQVAEVYGLSDGNFSRLLRKELPKDKKDEVYQAIEKAKRIYVGDK